MTASRPTALKQGGGDRTPTPRRPQPTSGLEAGQSADFRRRLIEVPCLHLKIMFERDLGRMSQPATEVLDRDAFSGQFGSPSRPKVLKGPLPIRDARFSDDACHLRPHVVTRTIGQNDLPLLMLVQHSFCKSPLGG